MTNFCQNRLDIEGSQKDVAFFTNECLTQTFPSDPSAPFILDFAKILPVPKDLDPRQLETWQLNEWEISPDRVEYSATSLTETSYYALFCSPWGAPEKLIRAIARQHPTLSIRFIGIEEGNVYCFKLKALNGKVEAENPQLTDALIEEVEGEGEISRRAASQQDWWEEPSKLKKPRMRHFRHWWDEARLRRTLTEYPLYTPPHRGLAAFMTAAQAQENFTYFLTQKDARVDALRRLLEKFGLRFTSDRPTTTELDRWLHRYGGLLFVQETRPSFYTHDPLWDAERRPLNVIFDLGVYMGELALRETPSLFWALDLVSRPEHGRLYESFQRPAILSSLEGRNRFPIDVPAKLLAFCDAQCNETYFSQRGGAMHRSRHEARAFFSFTLRDIHLRAIGEDTRADEEAWAFALGK